MKKISYYILLLLTTLSQISCEDYLTVLPENNQSSFEYWETKEEVEAVRWMDYEECRQKVHDGTMPNCIYEDEFRMVGEYLDRVGDDR